MEPETAKFGKPEKLADGKRVRVSVEVFGKGVFKVSRNVKDKQKFSCFIISGDWPQLQNR